MFLTPAKATGTYETQSQVVDGARIREGLNALWPNYGPYADSHFREEFAKQPNSQFWEMYLTVRFLDARKKLRSRAGLAGADRDTGPECPQRVALDAFGNAADRDAINPFVRLLWECGTLFDRE